MNGSSTPSLVSEFTQLLLPLRGPKTEAENILLRELQVQFVRLIRPMAIINLCNGSAVALAYSQYVGVEKVSIWFALIALFAAMQFWVSRKLSKAEMPEKVSGRLLRKAEFQSLLLGTLWGSIVVVFQSSSELANLYLSIVIAGMGAGTVAVLGPMNRISVRFLLSSMAVMLCATAFYNPPFAGVTLFMCFTLSVALIVGAGRSQFHLRGMIGREVEANSARNRLQDAIESTNDAFAFYDETGALALGNAQHKELFGEADLPDLDIAATETPETIRLGARWLQRSVHKTGQGGVVMVNTDITDIKTRERELVEARREAVDADEAKSRFLSTMSHELRSPLNIILSFSRLMASKSNLQLSPEEIAEYSDHINESGTHLLRLIDDIIDYSKVGLDRFMLETQPVNLRELLTKSVTLAASFENVEDLSRIDVSVSPKLGALRVDDRICRRIVMNLLTNAMRFSGSDGRLVVRAGLDAENRPFIAIRDFGDGIPEDEIERLFEAFYQRQTDGEHTGGTGLGLTLCRHLSRLHGGDVILKSRVGVGTTATFVLPNSTYIARPKDEQGLISRVA